MKITIYVGSRNECLTERMEIDGKKRLSVFPLCDCPEDAIIERSLVGCRRVVDFMREAHAAGVRGEPLDVVVHDKSEQP